MERLHVNAFGKLRMQYRDRVVAAYPTRHVEELLAYLLVHPQTSHNREKLIDMLWPASSTESARARFSTVLWRLRCVFQELGLTADSCLTVTRQAVAFAAAGEWRFDLREFETHLRSAENSLMPDERESHLVKAVAAYRGELLEGIYANWCLRERERYARQYLRAMGQLMACQMQREAYEEAIGVGDAILRSDPLREEVHRAIMYCYWKTNQRLKALQQYELCAQQLMDELRVLPMPTTTTLYQQIVADRWQNLPGTTVSTREELVAAYAAFRQAASHLNHLLTQVEAEEGNEVGFHA